MASKNFKNLLVLRTVAYFISIMGVLLTIFEFGPIIQTELEFRKDQLFGVKRTVAPLVITSEGTREEESAIGFGDLSSDEDKLIKPISADYGIVIEKINANSKVIDNIDPGNEKAYVQALLQGVVAAKGSTKPGHDGNLFIFSHSTDAPWNIVRYNAVFYLLRELGVGDRVLIFYQGRRYDYIVYDKTISKPQDISFLTNRYDKPVLTLQTCDPPGTLVNRLIIRAKLLGS